jgi:predicted nucleotidyltransferase component of viral defense system
LDPDLVEEIADRLRADRSLVEKDWHVVRAIGVLARLDHGDVTPVFSGGTSLSKGWGLLKRFSEDIDFKVGMADGASRRKTAAAARPIAMAYWRRSRRKASSLPAPS